MFFSKAIILIRDLYGLDAYMSVANLIGPGLFIPKAEYVIRDEV